MRELTASDERAMVVRAQAGDQEAFRRLFESHHLRVYNLVTYLLGDPTEAEDTTQSAFVRAWDELPRLRDPQAFTAWLNRIARNMAVDRARALRARSRADRASAEEPTGGGPSAPEGPEEAVLDRERDERVHEAVGRLPEHHREVVVMHHLEGLPTQEIAERLEVPLGTVLSRLARAREALRRRLARYVEGETT